MIKAFACSTEEDLLPLSRYLWAQKIPHKISEQAGEQIVWVPNGQVRDVVAETFKAWQSGQLSVEADGAAEATPDHSAGTTLSRLWLELETAPWTATFLLTSVFISLLRYFYGDIAVMRAFAIASFTYMETHGEYWRIISPIFLHFTLVHLVFNMVLLWTFGRQIEQKQPLWVWLSLVLASAAAGNIAQLYASGPFFGGMSGVVFGLLGYCWLWTLLNKDGRYLMPHIFMAMMVGWMVLGMTPLPELMGIGEMANAAHLVGWLAGLVMAVLISLVYRIIQPNKSSNDA